MPGGFSTNYARFFSPVSPVVHIALHGVGESCEMVREFFVRVLRSTGVLRSSNANMISCFWKSKSFYSNSSWSYSSMLQVALNKLQYLIQVS